MMEYEHAVRYICDWSKYSHDEYSKRDLSWTDSMWTLYKLKHIGICDIRSIDVKFKPLNSQGFCESFVEVIGGKKYQKRIEHYLDKLGYGWRKEDWIIAHIELPSIMEDDIADDYVVEI